jgi:hypothetical protein
MAFLTQAELKSHLYDEQVGEIVRGDTAIVPAGIDAGILEMKGYLAAYDITTIFAATGANRNALVLLFLKDIVVWHIITLCAPDIEYKIREERYKRAIQWLRDVQSRKNLPGLPTITTGVDAISGDTTHSGGYGGFNASGTWGGNRKRNNQL